MLSEAPAEKGPVSPGQGSRSHHLCALGPEWGVRCKLQGEVWPWWAWVWEWPKPQEKAGGWSVRASPRRDQEASDHRVAPLGWGVVGGS